MQTNHPTAEDLIDTDQVALRLGVTTRFVRRLVEERRIPFHKIGRFVRFRPGDVDDWIAAARIDQRNNN